jgi:hypothetical protein
MRNILLLAAALVLAGPSFALADNGMAGMKMQSPSGPVHHSDQKAKGQGLTAIFHFDAPKVVRYNCPMHPYEVSKKPGKDSAGMTMQKQNLAIGLTLEEANRTALKSAHVHLTLKDAMGMTQDMNLTNENGYYHSSFYVPAGHYQVIADVQPTGKGKSLMVATSYVVK